MLGEIILSVFHVAFMFVTMLAFRKALKLTRNWYLFGAGLASLVSISIMWLSPYKNGTNFANLAPLILVGIVGGIILVKNSPVSQTRRITGAGLFAVFIVCSFTISTILSAVVAMGLFKFKSLFS